MIHEGTSMKIMSKDGSEIVEGIVEGYKIFQHGPNAGRMWNITVRPIGGGHAHTFIRDRSQRHGGWINKTHYAAISQRSF